MKRARLFLAGLLLALIVSVPMVALASDISGALYSGTVIISNNSSAASNVATTMTLSTADLISQGYADATLSNIAVRNSSGADIPFGPSVNSSYPWSIWVSSIGANTQGSDILYTGGPSMSSTKYYFPGAAGMNVPDSASLEPSANYSDVLTNIFLSVGNILVKPGAFALTKNTNDITVYAHSAWELPASDSSAGWANPTNAYDNNTGTFASQTVTFNSWGTYFPVNHAAFAIDSVRVYPSRSNVAVTNMTVELFYGGVWNSIYNSTPTYSAWNEIDLSTPATVTAARLLFWNSDPGINYDARINEIAFGSTNSTDIAGVPDGEYSNVTVTSDGANLWARADSHISANVSAPAIPDNSNDWVLGGTNTPYIGTWKHYVGGNLTGSWAWQYSPSGTFTDLSGNGNTATPSFRTASSNANISANMTNFAPITTADAPAYSVASPSSFYSTNITTSGNFTTGNVTGAGFPGSAVVDAGAAASGVPNIWLWGLLGGFTLVMGGLAVSVMVRFGGGGNGELFIRMGLGIAIIGIMVALGKYDMWMIVFYLFIAGAFAMASRQYDIGASVGELNFIGFLAQSWVGLVGINRILEGSFMTSSESSQWNTLMFTQQYTIGDTFTLPIMNFSFWTEGLPNMVKWNYTFFGGNAQMIQYLLYSLTAILAFIIFGLIIGTLSRTFTR